MAKKVEPKKGRFREQQEAEAQAMMRMVMQGLLQRGRSGPQQRRSQRPQRTHSPQPPMKRRTVQDQGFGAQANNLMNAIGAPVRGLETLLGNKSATDRFIERGNRR